MNQYLKNKYLPFVIETDLEKQTIVSEVWSKIDHLDDYDKNKKNLLFIIEPLKDVIPELYNCMKQDIEGGLFC